MKSLIFLLSFPILSMTYKTSNSISAIEALIPNIEFDIQFVGTVTGTPTLKVNGVSVASSTSANHWTAFVDEANSYGKYNFQANKCYTLKGVGGSQGLCVTFNSSYKLVNCPQIQYNVATKTFTILNVGTNCTLKVSPITCCFNQAGEVPQRPKTF